MSIAEKIGHSADKTRFTLFKEGMFYKCYNEDAMVFAQKVRSYKINSKLVKNVDSVVLSLGFPVGEIKKGNLKLQLISKAIEAEEYNERIYGVVFLLRKVC